MVTAIIVGNSKTVAAVDHCGRRNHRGVPCGCLLKMKLQIPYDGIISIRPLSEEAI
jgi:hypothetical protein